MLHPAIVASTNKEHSFSASRLNPHLNSQYPSTASELLSRAGNRHYSVRRNSLGFAPDHWSDARPMAIVETPTRYNTTTVIWSIGSTAHLLLIKLLPGSLMPSLAHGRTSLRKKYHEVSSFTLLMARPRCLLIHVIVERWSPPVTDTTGYSNVVITCG